LERKETILAGWLPTAKMRSCSTIFTTARSQETSPCPLVLTALPPGAAPSCLLPTHASLFLARGAGQLSFPGCCWPKLNTCLFFSPLGLEMTSQAWRDWAQVSAAGCCHALLKHKRSHASARERTVWSGLPVSLASLQLLQWPEKDRTPSASCHSHAYAYICYKAERLFRHASISEYFHLAQMCLFVFVFF